MDSLPEEHRPPERLTELTLTYELDGLLARSRGATGGTPIGDTLALLDWYGHEVGLDFDEKYRQLRLIGFADQGRGEADEQLREEGRS